jgi:hypothetical protein
MYKRVSGFDYVSTSKICRLDFRTARSYFYTPGIPRGGGSLKLYCSDIVVLLPLYFTNIILLSPKSYLLSLYEYMFNLYKQITHIFLDCVIHLLT